MAGDLAILVTFINHAIFRTTIFIHRHEDHCPEAPPMACVIVYLSILYLLYETKARPEYWPILPGFGKFLMELYIIILVMEIALMFVWINVEIKSRDFINDIFDKDNYRRIGLHILLMFLSLSVFLFVGIITNLFEKVKKIYDEILIKWKSIKNPWDTESNRRNSVET
ncbi:hypothetical protein ACLKA6_011316 [Drosophila palustris]